MGRTFHRGDGSIFMVRFAATTLPLFTPKSPWRKKQEAEDDQTLGKGGIQAHSTRKPDPAEYRPPTNKILTTSDGNLIADRQNYGCIPSLQPYNLMELKFRLKLNLMAEYDVRTINIGAEYSFWKDYINAVIEFNRCRYFSGGVVFKVHLK